jgi:hypothetical protein
MSKERMILSKSEMIHPITFSIAKEKITTKIPLKTKLVSNLIPGQIQTYIYNNEEDYYNEYKQSLFAITTRKAGWDCMRHYEILANGCIPYFPNLEQCPINTMALLPKSLLYEANTLYEKHKDKQLEQLTINDMIECNNLIHLLLEYTRNHLTTSKLATYVLEKSNHQNVKSILYLSGNPNPDYLRCVTLHGFKENLGIHCHDYPKIQHIYKGTYSHLYGKGISYTNLLDHNQHDTTRDQTIHNDIINHSYDIVIYGSYHRGIPFYDLVSQYYKPNEVIFMCGEDDNHGYGNPDNHLTFVDKGHTVFVREMK